VPFLPLNFQIMSTPFVNYETAEELKELRFPQPIPEKGQTWYSGFKTEITIEAKEDKNGYVGFTMEGKNLKSKTEHFLDNNTFAPTIEDIKAKLIDAKAPVKHLENDPEVFATEWKLVFSRTGL
jgi:hypothetical protein